MSKHYTPLINITDKGDRGRAFLTTYPTKLLWITGSNFTVAFHAGVFRRIRAPLKKKPAYLHCCCICRHNDVFRDEKRVVAPHALRKKLQFILILCNFVLAPVPVHSFFSR